MQVLIKPVYTEFAHLGPGPDISDGPPGHVLVQGLNKFTHNFQKLTQVTGLDSLDLSVTDAPVEVVTLGLLMASRQPCDLHVARYHSCPGHQCQTNGQLLPVQLSYRLTYKL